MTVLYTTPCILLFIYSICVCENLGPALVLPNDVNKAVKGGEVIRTTTVYGFLDFTTTIDQTVVVFRPSSASLSSGATSGDLSSSFTSSTELPVTTKSASSPSSTSVSTSTSTSSSSSSPSQMTTIFGSDRDSSTWSPSSTSIRTEADEAKSQNRITPTPTLTPVKASPSQRARTSGAASALADKRRRFLAQVRRTRPQPPSSPSNEAGRGGHVDQEMAETIDVVPSKVKRYHDEVTALDDLSARNANRLLVRKMYRRPNHHTDMLSSKDRLLANRNRSILKSRFNGPVRARLDQQETRAEAALTSSSKPPFDPTSATIAEYLPIEEEEGGEEEEKDESKAEVKSKSVVQLEGSHSEFPFASTSVLEPEDETLAATLTLPVVKASREPGDPGLTVPIQLSIITSTYSLTETRLRTSLLPVYDGTSTTYYTLTHSFLVTKTVTTFQTVPPAEFMPYLIPGNDSLNAIDDEDPLPVWMNEADNSLRRKSDMEEEDAVEEGASNNNDQEDKIETEADNKPEASHSTTPTEQLSNYQNPGVNPLLQNLPFLNLLGPAAALGLNPYFPYGLGPQQLGPQVITTSRPVFSTSVVFTEKLLPIIDGLTTSFHTVRSPASTVTHTSFETYTQQQPQQGPGMGPMHHHQQQQVGGPGGVSTVTNPVTFVTTETQTSTQVFKLMYDGYKTSYRTVSSLTEVTRTITTHTTTTVPLYTHQPLLPFFG